MLSCSVLAAAILVTVGRSFVPPPVAAVLRGDMTKIFVLFLVFFIVQKPSFESTVTALVVLVAYVGLLAPPSSSREGFCPYDPWSLKDDAPKQDGAERCNYTLHPSLETHGNSADFVAPNEWLGPDGSQPVPAPEATDFAAFEEDAVGASFDQSFSSA